MAINVTVRISFVFILYWLRGKEIESERRL
jgi:hypothetical protein